MNAFLKIGLSALLIFAISETARRSSIAGALVASLPVVSVMSMIWLFHDTKDVAKVAAFSTGVLWLVIPSLVMFALLPPLLLRWKFSFPAALALASAATVATYFLMLAVLKRFGITL